MRSLSYTLCLQGTTSKARDRSILFFIVCPSPIATLFPYTTLFRSGHRGRATAPRRRAHRRHPGSGLLAGAEDRKSTRLNSRHVEFSYVGICLIKKTHCMKNRRRDGFFTVCVCRYKLE